MVAKHFRIGLCIIRIHLFFPVLHRLDMNRYDAMQQTINQRCNNELHCCNLGNDDLYYNETNRTLIRLNIWKIMSIVETVTTTTASLTFFLPKVDLPGYDFTFTMHVLPSNDGDSPEMALMALSDSFQRLQQLYACMYVDKVPNMVGTLLV